MEKHFAIYIIIYINQYQTIVEKMNEQVKIQQGRKRQKIRKKNKHTSSESEEFQLQYHQIKKLGLPINKKKIRTGNWAPPENLIYLKFLRQNYKDFVSEPQRRKNKVFYRLSKILKKRTPDQCRSHHQKLQMKYNDNVDQIIRNIERKLLKKSPHLLEEIKKQENISNKKTGIEDESQNINYPQKISEEESYYIAKWKSQDVFFIQINIEYISQWDQNSLN